MGPIPSTDEDVLVGWGLVVKAVVVGRSLNGVITVVTNVGPVTAEMVLSVLDCCDTVVGLVVEPLSVLKSCEAIIELAVVEDS